MCKSEYLRDELIRSVSDPSDDSPEMKGPKLAALARLDWKTAEPLLKDYAVGAAPSTAAVALSLLYEHAAQNNQLAEAGAYRDRLKRGASDPHSPDDARMTVGYVSEGGFNRLQQLLANHQAKQAPQTITQAELAALQQAADRIPIPGAIIDTIAQLRRDLGAKGIRVSDRRWGKTHGVLRAHALLEGRSAIEEDDLAILKYVLWSSPDRQSEITISEDVWDEVVVKGAGLPGSAETQRASQSGWIHIAQLANSAQLTTWRNQYSLGAGELSTILLAKEIQADVALIDERGARLLAKSEGVPVLGTVGLLELGYRSGEVTDLRLAYQTMLAQGAHIDQQILNHSLASFNLPPV